MESATVTVGHGHADHHHGPPEAHESSRIDRQTLGILLFIVSEVMLFGAFFASYFFLRVVVDPPSWPPEPYELPVAVAGINTAILVSSSFTIICPRAEDVSEAQVVRDLAATLAELYRSDIDATGQPMSPDPFLAVKNAIEHYRIDDILISTFTGERSQWLEDDLIGRVREITDKSVEHIEVGRPATAVAAAVAEGEAS